MTDKLLHEQMDRPDTRADNWRMAVVWMMCLLVFMLGAFVALFGVSVADSLDKQEQILEELQASCLDG